MFDKISEAFNRPDPRLEGLCLIPVWPTSTMSLEIIQNTAQGPNTFYANIKQVTVKCFTDIDTSIKHKNGDDLTLWEHFATQFILTQVQGEVEQLILRTELATDNRLFLIYNKKYHNSIVN